MRRNLLLALACSLAYVATAQPTWRFHLAFEDGTGARDTLWFIYDTNVLLTQSHWPVDMAEYAESRANLNYNDGEFHVFTINDLIDSTNSMASPYSWFPIFETGNSINAINWTPPMTITWDTSLFHAPYLPYDQGSFGMAIMDGIAFSQFDQSGEFGVFNMLIDDSVTIDFLWDYLFTFSVYFGPDDHVGMREQQAPAPLLSVWPNPARSMLHVQAPGSEAGEVLVSDLMGRRVLNVEHMPANEPLDVSSLHPGIYLIRVHTHQNHVYHGTFEKIP